MLAYGGLDHIAKVLAVKVCHQSGVDKDSATIIIYDQTAFATLLSYQAFVANLQVLAAAYKTLIPSDKLLEQMKRIAIARYQAANPKIQETPMPNEQEKDKQEREKYLNGKKEAISKSRSIALDPLRRCGLAVVRNCNCFQY